jgi:hypothetical protein
MTRIDFNRHIITIAVIGLAAFARTTAVNAQGRSQAILLHSFETCKVLGDNHPRCVEAKACNANTYNAPLCAKFGDWRFSAEGRELLRKYNVGEYPEERERQAKQREVHQRLEKERKEASEWVAAAEVKARAQGAEPSPAEQSISEKLMFRLRKDTNLLYQLQQGFKGDNVKQPSIEFSSSGSDCKSIVFATIPQNEFPRKWDDSVNNEVPVGAAITVDLRFANQDLTQIIRQEGKLLVGIGFSSSEVIEMAKFTQELFKFPNSESWEPPRKTPPPNSSPFGYNYLPMPQPSAMTHAASLIAADDWDDSLFSGFMQTKKSKNS